MSDLPWSELLIGIGGVVIMASIVSAVFRWATQFDATGPFSSVLTVVGVTGSVALGLLGGGLLVTAGWFFSQIFDGGF